MAQIIQFAPQPRKAWYDRAITWAVLCFSRPDDNPIMQVEFFKVGMMALFIAVWGISELVYHSFF